MNRLIALFRSDTLAGKNDSIMFLLNEHPSLQAKYRLINMKLSVGDTLGALTIYADIPDQYDLSVLQTYNYQKWGELLDIYLDFISDSLNLWEIDSLQSEVLTEMPAC